MSDAILMVGESVNPLKPEDYWLHDYGMVGYVVERQGAGQPGRLELWTSHGAIARYNWHDDPAKRDESISVGDWREAHHDQSGRTKGAWRVVGIVYWERDGVRSEGEVPSKKLRHGVYK